MQFEESHCCLLRETCIVAVFFNVIFAYDVYYLQLLIVDSNQICFKIRSTSSSADSKMCSGAYLGCHPISAPRAAVNVQLTSQHAYSHPTAFATPFQEMYLLSTELQPHQLFRPLQLRRHPLQRGVVCGEHLGAGHDAPLGERDGHGCVEVVPRDAAGRGEEVAGLAVGDGGRRGEDLGEEGGVETGVVVDVADGPGLMQSVNRFLSWLCVVD